MAKIKDIYNEGDAIVIDIGGRQITGTVTRNLGYRVEAKTQIGMVCIGTQDARVVFPDVLATYRAAKGQ